MVVLSKIYTKTGDQGQTSLGNGERTAKYDLRVQAYGSVDETNATLGMARLYAVDALNAAIAKIQNDLFDLGADLSCPYGMDEGKSLRIISAQVARLEREMDEMNTHLTPLRSFILPGGTQLAAHLHLSRTTARRAERQAVELAQTADINPEALKYLNRLSDWCFMAGRIANDNGKVDILWQPGLTRE